MEFEIEGTLKLPTLYFDDEKLVVKERDGSKKVYAYTDMSHFELSYKQMFANFATFSFQYQKKSIVIPYNKLYTKKLEHAVDQIKEKQRQPNKNSSSTFAFDDLPTDPFEFMKKFKEMLDLGIITQEEFDEKKKEAFQLKK